MRIIAALGGGVFVVLAALSAGSLFAPGTALPRAIRFATGAALYSALVFVILTLRIGYLPVYLATAALLAAAAFHVRARISPALAPMPRFLAFLIGTGALLYLVYALAPETQPDAFGYHLRLVSGYARAHAFTNRLTFFDLLPQGVEMLFVPAFTLGGVIAAKLVHFAFLLATVPLIRAIADEAGLSVQTGATGAAIFFLAPVCGIAGTAAYTDAALVCAACATLYLVLRWSRERETSLLLCAALNAGFCYTIKPTFGWVTLASLSFVAIHSRRSQPAFRFAAVAAAVMLPWLVRAYWLSGNPVAPFFNAWFPNPVSTPEIEHRLNAVYSAFRPDFSWSHALLDYTVAGGNQGTLGAAFLLLPLTLFALRKRAGKTLLKATALLAIPILANTGTRFLMPALAPASLALASVLPGPLGLGVVLLQAVSAVPPVMDRYIAKPDWRLGSVPWRAALGVTPENRYLAATIPGFAVTRMIEENTPAHAKIFACAPVPEAYISRELLTYWHSAAAQRFTDALHFAFLSQGTNARLLSWRWTGGDYRSLRVTAGSELRIIEASFANGAPPSQSWREFRSGESIRLNAAPRVTGADLLIWPAAQAKASTEGLAREGNWQPIEAAEQDERTLDLRRDATAYLRRSGFEYILIPADNSGFAAIGEEMMKKPAEWGVEPAGRSGDLWLFHILPGVF